MSDARSFFDAIARRYDRVYALSGAESRARLSRVLEILRGRKRVLVLGLGTGRELPALLDAEHEVTGLDISPKMIAQCNKRSRTVPTVLGDFFEPLPWGDASFDAVLALHGTLAHPPREGALSDLAREIGRVLAPGGVLVAEVPRAEGLARIAGSPLEGAQIVMTGETTFVHHDEVAGVKIEGLALTPEQWQRALQPLAVEIENLGEVEVRIVARARLE